MAKHAKSLSGRVAVVTGAASGIGRALAEELARRGARLALLDANESGLTQVASRLEALALPCDVRDEAAVAKVAARVRDE
ncbi:MAG: SDR family NAD(P)-dependent oxidoreductase, partial [Myxococcales bacterium]|nr:SDR family NAD(P)-dependent oxidoreductase [Myxococcales bacterium]